MRSSLYKFLTKEAGQVAPASPQKPALTLQTPKVQAPSALEGMQINTTPPAEVAPISANTNATPSNGNVVFRNGHTVKFDPSKVDWTTPDGPTPNNIGGTWYTDDQYNALDSIRKQLYSSYTSQGMDSQKARNLATRRAKQYVGDQMQMARGGTAFNKWKDQPAPAVAQEISTPATPTEESTPQAADTITLDTPVAKSTISPNQGFFTLPGVTPVQAQQGTSSQHEGYIQPLSKSVVQNTPATPQTDGTKPTQWKDAQEYLDAYNAASNKVEDWLEPLQGYEGKGLFVRKGDPSSIIRTNTGEPFRDSSRRKFTTHDSDDIEDALEWVEWNRRQANMDFLNRQGFKPENREGYDQVYVNPYGQRVSLLNPTKLYMSNAVLDDITGKEKPWYNSVNPFTGPPSGFGPSW